MKTFLSNLLNTVNMFQVIFTRIKVLIKNKLKKKQQFISMF